jgi:hypothetical protein
LYYLISILVREYLSVSEDTTLPLSKKKKKNFLSIWACFSSPLKLEKAGTLPTPSTCSPRVSLRVKKLKISLSLFFQRPSAIFKTNLALILTLLLFFSSLRKEKSFPLSKEA